MPASSQRAGGGGSESVKPAAFTMPLWQSGVENICAALRDNSNKTKGKVSFLIFFTLVILSGVRYMLDIDNFHTFFDSSAVQTPFKAS